MSALKQGMNTCVLFLLCATTATTLRSQTFKTLLSFDNTNGAYPGATLVQGTDGNLYGTTSGGVQVDNNVGTIFKIAPSGRLTTLYVFCSLFNCGDGAVPAGALLQSANGQFYGATYSGGAHGQGTAFAFTPGGGLTTLYSFCTATFCPDGANPTGGLVQAANGDFYGTTENGGGAYGEAFKMTPAGALTVLESFGGSNGLGPYAGLIVGGDGNFYGTTGYGGSNTRYGTVFRLTPAGAFTILHSFDSTDGAYPTSSLVQGTDGNFYGTTSEGGANNVGTVFKMTPAGALTTLHSFDGSDGWYPYAALIEGTDGNFYGTTYQAGANNAGTIFNITPGGVLTTLHDFDTSDGAHPYAGLLQDTNGTFYGSTANGGADNFGTLFSLDAGLSPFVKTEPTSGSAGQPVRILGTNLTGSTSVTFNGTAATFAVVSPSLITTTVPAGATTGRVEVTTPGGTLSSNVSFRVVQ